MKWQPIETALKRWADPIDVWAGRRVVDVQWSVPTYDGKEPGWVVWDGHDCYGPVSIYVKPEPTHWMLQPDPPSVA